MNQLKVLTILKQALKSGDLDLKKSNKYINADLEYRHIDQVLKSKFYSLNQTDFDKKWATCVRGRLICNVFVFASIFNLGLNWMISTPLILGWMTLIFALTIRVSLFDSIVMPWMQPVSMGSGAFVQAVVSKAPQGSAANEWITFVARTRGKVLEGDLQIMAALSHLKIDKAALS